MSFSVDLDKPIFQCPDGVVFRDAGESQFFIRSDHSEMSMGGRVGAANFEDSGDRIPAIPTDKGFQRRQTFDIESKNRAVEGSRGIFYREKSIARGRRSYREEQCMPQVTVCYLNGSGGGHRRELETRKESVTTHILCVLRVGTKPLGGSSLQFAPRPLGRLAVRGAYQIRESHQNPGITRRSQRADAAKSRHKGIRGIFVIGGGRRGWRHSAT